MPRLAPKTASMTLRVMAALVAHGGPIRTCDLMRLLDEGGRDARSRVSTASHELEAKGYLRFVGFYPGPKGRPSRIVEATPQGIEAVRSVNGRLTLTPGPDVPRYPPGWRANPMPDGAPSWCR